MKTILSTVLLFVSLIGFSQQIILDKDVKVGLVLSGGGAKGFAHIGVLKVLEEAGVKIDHIGGTSMGAVVGGLYAAGYAVEEIEHIIGSINFEELLQDRLPRKSKPFFEKEIAERYAITLPFKGYKVGLPKALSKGQSVLNLLTKLFEHVDSIQDFRKLPIPFFCIATDIETGKSQLLDRGFLPLAVRASASLPTILEPIEVGGKLLIDGGIANNFPVDEVRERGADIVIGVDVQSQLDKKEDIHTALQILNQIVGYQMYDKDEHKIEKVNVYLHPQISNYSALSFGKIQEIIAEGERVAKAHMVAFRKIASLQDNVKPKSKVRVKRVHQKIEISAIEINGNKNYTRSYILGKLKLEVGDKVTYDELNEKIGSLTSTGNIQRIDYRFEKDYKSGTSKLIVNLKESRVNTFVKFAAHYDDLYKSAILVNLTKKHILSKNDIFSADVIIGDNLRYNLDYLIDNGLYWSYGFKSRYNKFKKAIDYESNTVNKIAINHQDFSNMVYFQTTYNRKFALGVGLEHKFLKIYTETLPAENAEKKFYFERSHYLNLVSYAKFDTYDRKYFQTEGVYFDSDFKWYMTSTDFNNSFKPFSQLKGRFGVAHTFIDKLTAHFQTEAGLTIGSFDSEVFNYLLGGYGQNFVNNFIPFFGYDIAEIGDSAYLKSAFTFRHELFENNFLSFTANYARAEKDLFNKGKIFANTKSGYAIGYGLKTFMGPIELKHAWSPDTSEHYWYFNLGFWF